MTATTRKSDKPRTHGADKAITLALRLAHAENTLQAFTSGQTDAIVEPNGRTYLLHPAQEDLRQNERRLKAVIDSTADAITVVNRGGVILSQSRAVNRVLGYEPEELVGCSIFEVIHQEDLSAVYFTFVDVIEGFRENATAQFRHRARDGSWRTIEATLGKLRDDSSTSVVFSFRPIAGAREFTEAAGPGAREESLIGSAKPAIARIWRRPDREPRLLEEPHDFTAGGHPEVRLQLGSVDAHEAARSVLELCQREIAAAQVEVLLDFRAEENTVRADWAGLLEVMRKLLGNAVEFSTPGSRISIVSTNGVPGRLTFELADQGLGPKPLMFPRDFDSFQQREISAQQLRGGLNIARRLAEALGGTLAVSGNGRGKGATFRLTLNTAPLRNAAPAIVLHEAPSLVVDPLHILLVEDHGDAGLAGLLERCGHSVFAVPDMFTGLALAENCQFDLMISDITLPDGSGYELMERVRRTRPSLAAISLGGVETPPDIARSREAGFSWHLLKPVTLESLQSAIQAVAGERREACGETAAKAESSNTP